MSVIRRIQIGENHKSAEVLNRPTDDIQTLSGLTLGAAFPGFATVPALAAATVTVGTVGTSSPEGVLAGTSGKQFIQTDATTRVNRWIKRKGTDVYGWELDQPTLGLPSATPVLSTYGDSITAGQGASSTAHSYAEILAARLNATHVQEAIGGVGVLYAMNHIIKDEVIPRTGGVVTWMSGLNDVRRGGSAPKTLAKITLCYRAGLAALFAKTVVAADNGSVSTTGAWSNFATQGMSAHLSGNTRQGTTGSTASYTFTGDSIIVGFMTSDSASATQFGNASITVDGVTVGTCVGLDGTDSQSDGVYDNTVGYGATVIRGLGSGSHTVVVTVTSAFNFALDWFGTLNAPQACPPVLVGTIPRMSATGYSLAPASATDAIVAQASQLIINVVAEYEGFPVRVVFPNTTYDLATGVGADNIHPNDVGHALLAQAFLNKISGGGSAALDVSTPSVSGTAHIGKNSVASAASSTAFGDAASASGTNTVSVGTNANAAAASSTVVGSGASAAGLRGVAIGTSAAANSSVGTDAVAMGQAAVANHNGAVAVGSTASISGGQYGVAVGYGASVTASDGCAVGRQAAVTHAESTAIGTNAATTALNQVMLGTASQTVTSLGNVNLGGSGKTLGFLGATPVVRPTLAAASTDLATVITLANSIRTALINLGLGV